jgi:hypothetical protein
MASGHMKRREFITLLGGAAAGWPLEARAQKGERIRRVGVLMNGAESDPIYQAYVSAFVQTLQRLGWREGRISALTCAGQPPTPNASALMRLSWWE